MKNSEQLQLLADLWADLQQPDLVWQIAVLAGCLGLAFVFAGWWRRRSAGESGRLHGASTRLAFPVVALLLAVVAQEVLAGMVHLKLLAVAIHLLVALALVRGCVYVLRRSFPGAAWLAISERWVAAAIWIGLALQITGLAPGVIRLLEGVSLTIGNTPLNLWVIGKGVLTVLATVVLALWLGGVIETRLMRVQGLDSSLRIVSVRVAKALLTLAALMAGLSLVGIDITALSVFTGALGVGLGFGLQKIASNYVSGFIILLDRSIRIGNVIQVNNETGGIVSEITTRYTVLKNFAGMEFIVPNEVLISSTVQNQSYSDSRVRVAFGVGVSYATPDLEAVLRSMENTARQHPRVIADPPPRAFLKNFGDSAIELELGFWIADPEQGLGNVRSDVALAVWQSFRDNRVEIPFPQRVVHLAAQPARQNGE